MVPGIGTACTRCKIQKGCIDDALQTAAAPRFALEFIELRKVGNDPRARAVKADPAVGARFDQIKLQINLAPGSRRRRQLVQ